MKQRTIFFLFILLFFQCNLEKEEEDFFSVTIASTTTDGVNILEDFEMPELNTIRRIWIYLPTGYEDNTNNYPVIYMQDGQNLFDNATSFSGEWQIDETIDALISSGDEGTIVVGIDNGGGERVNEYSPWVTSNGGGKGDEYIEFIVETLKPQIDANFRTLRDRNNTAIMGSSMGAFISMAAFIKHQDVFGNAGILSPSFWFTDEIYNLVETIGKEQEANIYMSIGQLEGGDVINDMQRMGNALRNAGFTSDELKEVVHFNGAHNESYWSFVFPEAYDWFFD